MSDFDDELLELVEAGSEKEKKRKRTKSKSGASSKRRKASVSDDDGPESEEEEDDPYPLEGKYVDEADMNRLLQMSEVEREEILSQRAEERQRIQDKRALQQMVKDQRADGDSVAKAAKRQHTARGATKEKSRKLDELKAKRRAKDEKNKNRDSSPKRERSSSPMDMDMETSSEEEEEEGMISKAEQEEDTYGRRTSEPDIPITLADLEACRLNRNKLAKHCMMPWFDKYVEGAWVRYLIGSSDDGPVYRICQIDRLCDEASKAYKIDNTTFDRNVELIHGKSRKTFPLDKVSNSPFSPKEFERFKGQYQSDKIPLPTKNVVAAKVAQLEQLASQPKTEGDIAAMLLRKGQLNANRPGAHTTFERARLVQERTLAQRRQDYKEVAEIDAKLAEFDAQHGIRSNGTSREGTPGVKAQNESKSDVLAMLSEKNRKANAEAVRRAEIMEAEKRRRERKLAMSGSGTATPTDPSARLRTVPRTFNAATPTSRPGTPSNPTLTGAKVEVSAITDSPSQSNGTVKTFEASVIESVEIDLGDF
ncbi:RNA polymerase-associated protein rtf1 [Marasmius sp. AFHP31]|nr:RNA polymerase-associated protein rtf1 [Marasmius sp. AFHP31]